MLTAADVEPAYVASPLYTPVIESVCGVVPPPPPLLPPPPHPAIPAAKHANNNAPAQAYPSRLGNGATRSRDKLRRIADNSNPATIHIGPSGERGARFDPLGGVRRDRVVISVAVQVPGVVLVPAVGVQVAGVPRAVVPFMNVTVPVGPAALLLVPVTFAVRVTLPPELMLVALAVTTVVVT
jgi:hypothetical protein